MVPDLSVTELHHRLLETLDDVRFSGVRPLKSTSPPGGVADDPTKSYVTDSQRNLVGVLILSNEVNPQLVGRSVATARQVKHALGDRLGNVVLEPLVDGQYLGRSYALWPLRRALSRRRVPRYVQRQFLRRQFLRWLAQATAKTLRDEESPESRRKLYVESLELVARHARVPAEMRDVSVEALRPFTSEDLRAVTVFQHSDVWLGNFLLPYRSQEHDGNEFGFYLIDWTGGTLVGHPFYDLLRFSASNGMSPARLRSELENHCQILGCDIADTPCYTVAALGALGLNLEHFPEDRYVQLCADVFQTLSTVL